MRITQKLIAERSGVSQATVSRILSGREDVSIPESTRQAVRNAAREMRYGLSRRKRSCTVGFLFNLQTMENKELKDLLTGSSAAFESAGVTVRLMNVKSPDEPDLSGVDGLLLYNFRDETVVRTLSKKLPLVLLDYAMQGITSVLPDNAGGVYNAVSYLAGIGHRRIAFFGFRPFGLGTRARYIGYLEGLDETGIKRDERLISIHDAAKQTIEEIGEDAALALKEWYSLENPPTAVVTSGDAYALPLLNRAMDMGIRVPEDLSIAGFDDTASCRYSRPSLTSIRQPFKEMGFAAAEALLDEIETHHKVMKTILVDTELVIRNSTAPVSGTGNPPAGLGAQLHSLINR